MDNYQKLRLLANHIMNKDYTAWQPFIDLLIEMGYEKIARVHYERHGASLDFRQCALIPQVLNHDNEEDFKRKSI